MHCEFLGQFASVNVNIFPLFEHGVTPQNAYDLLAV